MSWWNSILEALRIRRSRFGKGVDRRLVERVERRAIELIRGSTHPDHRDDHGRRYEVVRGTVYKDGMWCANHNGRLMGGWYAERRRHITYVKGPNGEVNEGVVLHEIMHDHEWKLGLAPPWHYRGWRGLGLLNWR